MLKYLFTTVGAAVILAAGIFGSPAVSADDHAAALSETQAMQVEKLIERYLDENPEVVVRAFRKYQRQQEAAEQLRQKENLASLRGLLENSDGSPVRGNPEGDVTLVEFFDYRCGYCKRVHGTVTEAVTSDGNVKLVYKELPILGPNSVFASRASLGVFFTQPLKYPAFHDALMTSRGQLNPGRVISIAEGIGLKPEDIKKAMKDPRVDEEIQRNMQLAQSLGINGTPGFVIGSEVVPGAVDGDALKELIAKARQG